MAKIIYEPHPISRARKVKLQAEGYKIIDAIFAPVGTPVHQKLDVEEYVTEAAELEVEGARAREYLRDVGPTRRDSEYARGADNAQVPD